MITSNKNYFISCLFFLFFFIGRGCCYPYLSLWLTGIISINYTDVGLVYSFTAIVAACVQPLSGFISDKLVYCKNLTQMLVIVTTLFALYWIYVFAPLLKINVLPDALAGSLYTGMAYGVGCGVCEAYTGKVSRVSSFESGRVRMSGGIGVAIGTFAAGKLYGIDQNMILWLASGAGVCPSVIVWKMQISAHPQQGLLSGKVSPVTFRDAVSLLRVEKFWFFALYVIGVRAVYETYDQQFATYYSHFPESKTRGAEAFGYLTTGQILLDAITMLFTPWFVSKIGPRNALLYYGLITSPRIIGSVWAIGPASISLTKLLHGLESSVLPIVALKYTTANFNPLLSATVYPIGFQFSKSFSSIFLSTGIDHMYQNMGFTSNYIVLGGIVLYFTFISSITLDKAHAFVPQPVPANQCQEVVCMSHLFYGVVYYDEYTPEDRLAKDIALTHETGINVVRIAESTWSTLEPEEGQYNLYHIDRALGAMHEAGTAVVVGTPTYVVPTWLAAKHPNILVIAVAGQQRYGPRQIMDTVNPTLRRYAEKTIRMLMAYVQHHPAIIGWQLDNETKHYDNIGRYMQEGFVRSLQEKCPDLRQLNRDFGLDYWSNRIDRWQDFSPVENTINANPTCVFSRYQRQQVTKHPAWQAAIIREYAQPHQFVTYNFDFEWRGCSYGVQPRVDHFAATQALDIAGADIYHLSQAHLTGREIASGGAITRPLEPGQNYFVLETQAQGLAQWAPFPDQLCLQAFSHIASGAAMVSHWHQHSIHNAFETYWKGLFSHDFSHNSTWQEATSIGADFACLLPQPAELKAENDAVLLISNETMDVLNHFRPDDAEGNTYNNISRRFHDALYDHNISLDIIHDVNEEASRYRVLIVSGLYAADNGLLTRVNDYTAWGDRVLIGFKSGFSDENAKVHNSAQPGILRQSCGVSYSQFTLPEGTTVSSCCAEIDCCNDNQAELWMELLTPDGGIRTPLCYQHPAWDEYAAATAADYSQGCALYVGFLPHKRLTSQLFDVLTVDLIPNS